MAKQDRGALKSVFETGDTPNGGNYADLVDSYVHKDDLGEANVTYSGATTSATTGGAYAPDFASGWGCEIKNIDDFRYLRFHINPNNASMLPTQVRVWVRSQRDGTVLGTATVALSGVAHLVVHEIFVDFGSTIVVNPSTSYFFEFQTDGRAGYVSGTPQGWTPQGGTSYGSRYSQNQNLDAPTWTNASPAAGYIQGVTVFTTATVGAFEFNEGAKSSILNAALEKSVFFEGTEGNESVTQELIDAVGGGSGGPNEYLGTETGTKTLSKVNSQENQTYSGGANVSSGGFRSWGWSIGGNTDFQFIRFYVRAYDAGNIPNTLAVRLKDGYGGPTIFESAEIPVNLVHNENKEVIVDIGSIYANIGPVILWLDVMSDGIIAIGTGSGTVSYTPEQTRYGTSTAFPNNYPTTGATGGGFSYGGYTETYESAIPNGVVFSANAVANMAEQLGVNPIVPKLNLSPITHVNGFTTQIFHRGLLEVLNPEKYDFLFTGMGGKPYPRYYELTNATLGLQSLNISIRDEEGTEVTSGVLPVNVVAANSQPSSAKKILCIGDSLTAGGNWVNEFRRILQDSGGTPSGLNFGNTEFIGTLGTAPLGYEGYGGKTWTWYTEQTTAVDVNFNAAGHGKTAADLTSIWQDGDGDQWTLETVSSSSVLIFSRNGHTSNPPVSGALTHVSGATNTANINYTSFSGGAVNPFWNAGTNQLDITNYITSNGFGTVDIVYALLGWNNIPNGNYTPEAWDGMIADAETWLDQLHADYPSCKVKIMGLQLPSWIGGLAANYGDNARLGNYFNVARTVWALNTRYKTLVSSSPYNTFCEFVEMTNQFDAEYNYPKSTVGVNSRNTTDTEIRGTNGVHPDGNGYNQIADIAFRNFAKEYL